MFKVDRLSAVMRRTDGRVDLQAGFTYLWVLLSVAFLATGLALAAETYSVSQQREQEKELLRIGHEFRAAIGSYHAVVRGESGTHEYPISLDDLLKDNRAANVRRHLRKIYADPLTGKAEWGLVTVGGRIVGIHSMSLKLPIKQRGFDTDDAGFQGRSSYAHWQFIYPTSRAPQGSPN